LVSISVIIVNYNARYFLKNCINSILSSDIVNDIEIIVVDNNSSDGSSEMMESDYPGISYIYNDKNVGFSKANNQGVTLAKGAYVLILNPDTMLSESILKQMLKFSRGQDDFGAAGVQFIDGSGQFLPESKRNFPGLKVAGAKLLGYSRFYYANHLGANEIAEVDILTGAFMFIKREVFLEVGGFDEDFFMYGEDIDLSYRIKKAGYKNYYVGSLKVLHFKGESTVKDKTYLQNFYGALSIFYKKHFPRAKILYRVIEVLISMIIRFKSMTVSPSFRSPVTFDCCACLGNDDTMSRCIHQKYPDAEILSVQRIDEEISKAEIVFFDSSSLSYKAIIDAMGHSFLLGKKKRIISRDRQFYLGSDASNERGEVVMF